MPTFSEAAPGEGCAMLSAMRVAPRSPPIPDAAAKVLRFSGHLSSMLPSIAFSTHVARTAQR